MYTAPSTRGAPLVHQVGKNLPFAGKYLQIENKSRQALFIAVAEEAGVFVQGANISFGPSSGGVGIQRIQTSAPPQIKVVNAGASSKVSIGSKVAYLTVATKNHQGIYYYVRVSRRMDSGETWVATDDLLTNYVGISATFC